MTEQNTLYIHVGMPKTGTTAIQRVLANNRKQLKALGYIYPGTREHHWPLVEGIREKKRMLTNGCVRDTLVEVRDWDGDAILSCEGFGECFHEGDSAARSVNIPQNISEALNFFEVPHRIVMIMYVRRQDIWLDSGYRQRVKDGLTDTFDEYFDNCRAENFALVDYLQKADAWGQCFGDENVIVRPYDPAAWLENSLHADLLGLLGLSAQQRESIDMRLGPTNPSLSTDAISAFMLIGKFLGKTDLVPGDPIFKNSFCYEGNSGDFISPAQRTEVLDALSDSNETLARKYLELAAPKELFPPLVCADDWTAPALSKEDARSLIELIIAAMPHHYFIYKYRMFVRLGSSMYCSNVPLLESLAFVIPCRLRFLKKSLKEHVKSLTRPLRRIGHLFR